LHRDIKHLWHEGRVKEPLSGLFSRLTAHLQRAACNNNPAKPDTKEETEVHEQVKEAP
jgi:hypothetical protein